MEWTTHVFWVIGAVLVVVAGLCVWLAFRRAVSIERGTKVKSPKLRRGAYWR
jgi:cytochrome c-type biogenesis protein CcmH/NrfF